MMRDELLFELHLVYNEKGELLNFTLTKDYIDDGNQELPDVLTKICLENSGRHFKWILLS